MEHFINNVLSLLAQYGKSKSFTCHEDGHALGTIGQLQRLVDILDHELGGAEHAPVDKAGELGGEGVVHGGHEAQVSDKVLIVNRSPVQDEYNRWTGK